MIRRKKLLNWSKVDYWNMTPEERSVYNNELIDKYKNISIVALIIAIIALIIAFI